MERKETSKVWEVTKNIAIGVGVVVVGLYAGAAGLNLLINAVA